MAYGARMIYLTTNVVASLAATVQWFNSYTMVVGLVSDAGHLFS